MAAMMTIGSMYLASCIFGKQLMDDTQSHGLVMELPPYHKPKWRHILRSSLMKAWDIFWRAFTVIYAVSIVFYLLSYHLPYPICGQVLVYTKTRQFSGFSISP